MSVFTATKKPVAVEAIQLTTESIRAVYEFINVHEKVNLKSSIDQDKWTEYEDIIKRDGFKFKTLESDGQTQTADIGDYIIKGVKGEFYPCKPEIFKLTYDF